MGLLLLLAAAGLFGDVAQSMCAAAYDPPALIRNYFSRDDTGALPMERLGLPAKVSAVTSVAIEREVIRPAILQDLPRFLGVRQLPYELSIDIKTENDYDGKYKAVYTVAVEGHEIDGAMISAEVDTATNQLTSCTFLLAVPTTVPAVKLTPQEALSMALERAELEVDRFLKAVSKLEPLASEGSLVRTLFIYDETKKAWRLVHSILVEQQDQRTQRYRLDADVVTGQFVRILPALHPGDRAY